MALRTLAADGTTELIPKSRVEDGVLEVIDGDRAFLKTHADAAPESGDRVEPGESIRVEAQKGAAEILHAIGADATFQFRREQPSSGGEVRRITKKKGGEAVSRPLARAENQSPGANTDILSSDISPPETGTLIVTIVLASAAEFNAQVDTPNNEWEVGFNDGSQLTANEGFQFTLACRGDTSYNFQVESAVTVNLLQVEYTRGARA